MRDFSCDFVQIRRQQSFGLYNATFGKTEKIFLFFKKDWRFYFFLLYWRCVEAPRKYL